jgi:protein tyrosine/serine phosphatase
MEQALAILENEGAGPVFVHCKRGADRTGAVIGAYRIEHDGWTNDRALAEAKALGMSPFQLPRAKFIHAFQPHSVAARNVPPEAGVVAPSVTTP